MRKVFLLLIFATILMVSCDYFGKDIEKKVYLDGIITNKFFDDKNHGSATFTIKTKNSTLLLMSTLYPNSWEYAEIGDSIIKEKGELYLTIKKKNNDSKMFPYFQ